MPMKYIIYITSYDTLLIYYLKIKRSGTGEPFIKLYHYMPFHSIPVMTFISECFTREQLKLSLNVLAIYLKATEITKIYDIDT